MIQVYFTDEKDFIIDFRDFEDNDNKGIGAYIVTGLNDDKSRIISIKKWPNAKVMKGK